MRHFIVVGTIVGFAVLTGCSSGAIDDTGGDVTGADPTMGSSSGPSAANPRGGSGSVQPGAGGGASTSGAGGSSAVGMPAMMPANTVHLHDCRQC